MTLKLDDYSSMLQKEFDTRPCNREDFGDDELSNDIFNKMNNSNSINLCPDFKNTDEIYLSGDNSYA